MKMNKTAVELLLAKNQLSVREMTRKAGISTKTYYNGCNKEILPMNIGAIASALGVDPKEIVLIEEE